MTSQEIATAREIEPEWCKTQHPTIVPLWEIALQLAVQNEQAQKRHEENIQQRDAFLLADPKPSKTNPFGERGTYGPTAAEVLRSCAATIQENDLDRRKAVDYLLKCAETVESADHGENLNPHLTRVDSADITCPNCCRPFWVHVSMVGPWNPPKDPADSPADQPQWTAGGSIQGTE